MNDGDKTKEQLIDELAELRQRIAELEALEAEYKQQGKLIRIQRDLMTALNNARSLDETLRLCTEAAINATGLDCGGVYLVDRASGALDLAFHTGLSPYFIQHASHYDADSSNALLVMAGEPVYTRYPDVDAQPNGAEGLRALSVIPVRHEDQVIACLNIASHTLDDIPAAARDALESIGGQIGSAIARSQAEAALLDSEIEYGTLVDNAGQAILVAKSDGMFGFINPMVERLTGCSEKELFSRPFVEFIHPDDQEMVMERYAKRLRGEELPAIYSFRVVHKDGSIRWVELNAVVIMWEGEGATLNFLSDVTERKRMEQELQKIEKLESIGVLAGGIAHDFNNLLAGIMGNISLAKIYKDPAKVSASLLKAERASMRARELTQQLLTFSKGGAPIRETASIAEVLRDSAGFALSGSNVKCEVSIPDDLWSGNIDTGQISQVINNLIINADQAMPDGGVIGIRAENRSISVSDTLPLKDGDYVKISVEDQGIGISAEHLQKIFDPYFTTKQKGSGLGLATSFSIVKNHDGHITAESQVGIGTAFHIYLPAVQEEVATAIEENGKPIMGAGRILVMDDDEVISELVNDILDSLGYKTTIAADGATAIELYKKAKESGHPFDAVIMDLTIPGGMGGKDVIPLLIEIDPEVKAIVSSGYSDDPIMANFKDYGFRDVLAKPYRIRELSEVLSRVIGDG